LNRLPLRSFTAVVQAVWPGGFVTTHFGAGLGAGLGAVVGQGRRNADRPGLPADLRVFPAEGREEQIHHIGRVVVQGVVGDDADVDVRAVHAVALLAGADRRVPLVGTGQEGFDVVGPKAVIPAKELAEGGVGGASVGLGAVARLDVGQEVEKLLLRDQSPISFYPDPVSRCAPAKHRCTQAGRERGESRATVASISVERLTATSTCPDERLGLI
jgi:hypothetical protein